MKLNYRGVTYEQNSAEVAIDEGKVGGKFRGCNWRIHNLKNAPVVKHSANLVYRGVPVK